MAVPPLIISDGTGFPASMSGAIWSGQSGQGFSGQTFEKSGEPSTRHWIGQQLYGNTGQPNDRRFRAYESLDKGQTWVEMDAGNGPRYSANQPAISGATAMTCATAQDYAGKRLFLIYWDVNMFLSIVPFNQATKQWGAPVTSTFIETPPLTNSGWLYRNACYRPSDGSVWLGHAVGAPSGAATWQLAKFAAGTLALTLFTLPAPQAFTNCTIWGLQTNPVDNTLVGVTYSDNAQTNLSSFVVHTDDSVTVNNIEPTGTWSQLYDGPIVDANGQAKICVIKVGDNTQAQVIRWQSADVPVYSIDVVAIPADQGGFIRLATRATGETYICYKRTTGVVRNFVYKSSTAIGQPWSAEGVLGSNIISIADARILPSFFNQTPGLGISMGYQNFSEGGQGFLEVDFAGPPPPALTQAIAQALIVPFPVGDPCCSPKTVGCVDCSHDGKMYAISKGPYGKAGKKK